MKNKIERFAAKPAYVFIVCMIAFAFHALALDAAGLVLFAVTSGIFLVVFDDPRPAFTVIFCTVFVISTQNSSGHYDDEAVYFFKPEILTTLIVAGAFLFAVIEEIRSGRFRRRNGRCRPRRRSRRGGWQRP